MELYKLFKLGKLSQRAIHICNTNNLATTHDLIEFKDSGGDFLKLRNAGRKVNTELNDVIEKYHFNTNLKESLLNKILIKDFFNNGDITTRAYNVCCDYELFVLGDLLKFKVENGSFEKIRSAGTKTRIELDALLNNYLESNALTYSAVKTTDDKTLMINSLRFKQRQTINSYIKINFLKLKIRSQNGLMSVLEDQLSLKKINQVIFENYDFNFKNIQNIGANSALELHNFIYQLKSFITTVSSIEDDLELEKRRTIFFLKETFYNIDFSDFNVEVESIFSIVNYLVIKNALFDKNKTKIISRAFKLFQDQKELSLDEIANEVNLTRERVRQIRKKSLSELYSKISLIKNFNDDLIEKYNIDINADQIVIDDETVLLINKINNLQLSKEFISYIIYVYLSSEYELLGNIEDVLQINSSSSRNRHNWGSFYLIKTKIVSQFDFTLFVNDIEKRIKERIDESYSFNFKSYLVQFLRDNNMGVLDSLLPVLENIVNDEFDIHLDLEENLVFKRNTFKQSHEYAYEALEEIGEPSRINIILSKIRDLNPDYETDEHKVRSSLKRINGFVPIGRKSVFGLKKWEGELDNFKGGTIKDVIISFLEDKDKPMHISKVLEYLDRYRENKDAKSVLANLKLDPEKRFVIFHQGFIGLKTKKDSYCDKYEFLPVQLGKTIISKHKKGFSINSIQSFLKTTFGLSSEESILIMNNLKYFNENKTI